MPRPLPFATAFKLGDPSLAPFFPYLPGTFDWEEVITARGKVKAPRVEVSQALAQDPLFAPYPAVQANIQRLARPHTFTITTGQQPGLFGGALLTAYKAAAAVAWCQRLSGLFPQHEFVPVFWAATEDHDAAEVNHTWLRYPQPTRYAESFGGGAAGSHRLQPSIQGLYPAGGAVLARTYTPGRSFGDAFRALMLEMFGSQGLVVIDPAQPALKRHFAPIAEAELLRQPSYAAFVHQTQALQAAGYAPQAQARPVNLFSLAQGPRTPITPEHPLATLAAVAHTQPEQFSPNVVLRPVYQEALLPNLAYIGGWGELAYWAQLRGVFQAHSVPFPVVLPRPNAVGFPVSARAQLSAEQLSVSCLLSDENIIREIYVSKVDNENESAALQLAFEDLLTQAEARYGPAGALRNQVVRHLAHLRHRQQNRALARHSGYQNLLRTQRVWHPAGYVQERSLNAWAFYQDNPEAFGRFLVQHLEPSETATQVYFYTNGETPVSELRIGTQ